MIVFSLLFACTPTHGDTSPDSLAETAAPTACPAGNSDLDGVCIVFERTGATFTLAEAVRKLTSQPAAIFGLKERGLLQPGYWADLLLFDPATVGRGTAYRANDLPAGATRIVRPALGVHGVWVNGQQMVDGQGKVSLGQRPGQVLREFDSLSA